MKSFGSLLVGWGLAQHNFYFGSAVLIAGLALIAFKLMTEPYPDEEEEK
ncbi:hypothetical protein HF863_00770 [Lactobacillus agilis]|uniref:Uncharacterized protein n=1 Tax=Ligilactobacillus agilis TaxID=1601 RepID=A0A848C3M7_9LACO|nr:hypothetical protein [Ligilactobacillus agilis]NME41321.1 hypothetical protein [Ligilactobacillus agilis]